MCQVYLSTNNNNWVSRRWCGSWCNNAGPALSHWLVCIALLYIIIQFPLCQKLQRGARNCNEFLNCWFSAELHQSEGNFFPRLSYWNGILLGTELRDSTVRTVFSTGSFHGLFIWLTTEFQSYLRVQQVWHHCDGSRGCRPPASGSNIVHF